MGSACHAAASFADGSILDPRILILMGLLTGALLLGALVIALVDRWRKKKEPELRTTHDQLASFRAAFERGEMSKDEFDRVRAELTKPLKPAPKPAAPPAIVPDAPPPPASETTKETGAPPPDSPS